MILISIVGHSGSGKTTLITRLVPILKQRGFKIAVIKHARDFEIDKEGKDSHRIWQSGADVAIVSNDKTAMILGRGMKLEEICRFFEDYDVVLTEGFSSEPTDKIVVLDEANPRLEKFSGNIIAVVSDSDVPGFKTFRKHDIERLAEFIVGIIRGIKGKNF